MVPQNEIQPLARSDIIGSMSFASQMNDAMTLLMSICEAVLAMVGCTHASTELKPSSSEVQTKANVEGDIRVIGVHIQTQVFTFSVSYDKAVVPIPATSRTWKESFSQRLQQFLQLVDERLQANIAQNDSLGSFNGSVDDPMNTMGRLTCW